MLMIIYHLHKLEPNPDEALGDGRAASEGAAAAPTGSVSSKKLETESALCYAGSKDMFTNYTVEAFLAVVGVCGRLLSILAGCPAACLAVVLGCSLICVWCAVGCRVSLGAGACLAFVLECSLVCVSCVADCWLTQVPVLHLLLDVVSFAFRVLQTVG